MKLGDLATLLSLDVQQAQGDPQVEVSGAYSSDVLSDVLAYGRAKNIWITCQTHPNIVAVAKLKDLAGIILVNNRRAEENTLRDAREEKIIIYGTPDPAFTVAGKLYKAMNKNSL